MSGLLFGKQNQAQNYSGTMEASLRVQTSAYGLVVPIVYGTTRVTGNLIWYGGFTAIPHTTSSSSGGGGGKGGGGGSSSGSTSYTYTTSLMLGLSEGTAAGGDGSQMVLGVWKDKAYSATNTLFSTFSGSAGQSPWAYLTSTFPSQALSYSNIAYVAAANYDLDTSSNTPNHSFELRGRLWTSGAINGYDVNPKGILTDYLTNANYGAGFPAAKLGDWTQYDYYTRAMGLVFSPNYDSAQPAHQAITEFMQITNSGVYFSEGKLKITPYGDTAITANGVTYTPNLTPIYALGDDDFIYEAGRDPVTVTRGAVADAYNQVQLEILNRANQYNVEVIEAKDQAGIDTRGVRPQSSIKAHAINDASVGRMCAQLILQRSMYVRNTYEFKVGAKFAALEPTDYITITDSNLGLSAKPVRILTIQEDTNYEFTITAEDAPAGVYSAATYSTQTGSGNQNNYNISGGNTNAPVVFEAPAVLASSGNGLEVWLGASGGANWGGADVWVSYDGNSYTMVGSTTAPARQGVLSAALASGSDPDTTNTLAVDLSVSAGTLTGVSQTDADTYSTLSYADGELISYENATLTAANQYNLTYLRRGAYNTTIAAHAAGKQFMRLDDAIFKMPFTSDKVGKTIYIKLPSSNIYGSGTQALADVQPTQYTIKGSAYTSSLPNVAGLTTSFISNITNLKWNAVSDFRQPNIQYEVRMGATWASASVLGRTPTTNFQASANGTYWVSAYYLSDTGLSVYSASPTSIVIGGAVLSRNVVASWSEQTSWAGTLSGGAAVSGGQLTLAGAGNMLADANVLAESDIIYYGGVSSSGTYTIPATHIVNAGRVVGAGVTVGFTAAGVSIYDNVLTVSDWLNYADALGALNSQYYTVTPQINVAQADGIYTGWQNYTAGVYKGQYFKAQLIVTSSSTQVVPYVSAMQFTVDVPDRLDTGTITTATGGSAVTYASTFNGGNGGVLGAAPSVQITIVNASAGDDVILTAQTTGGFTVQVVNGGAGVSRTVNWLAQGY